MEYNKGDLIMEEIIVNLDNLTNEERETLLKLVKKGNKTNKKRERLETYYFISDEGAICCRCALGAVNEIRYRLGNYFQTKEEAGFARKKQLIYQKLKDYALEHNTEEIDLNNNIQHKWFMRYDNVCKKMRYYCMTSLLHMHQIYFTSEKIARAAVEEIGEDNIKKYLFGVKE